MIKEVEFYFNNGATFELDGDKDFVFIQLIDFQIIDCYDSYIKCGKTIPDTIVENNVLKIRFKSHEEGSAFSIHFKTMLLTEIYNFPSEDMWAPKYISNEWECSGNNQNHFINASSGILLSPNYPNNYGNSDKCVWRIYVPTGSQLSVQFWSFDTEVSIVPTYLAR